MYLRGSINPSIHPSSHTLSSTPLCPTVPRSLKPGGLLVYSTCSISPLENDGVITKILKRNKGDVELAYKDTGLPAGVQEFSTNLLSDGGLEETECGWSILPDRSGGWGPIYFSVMRKL